MTTKVHAEQTRLHDQYAWLRIKILKYYDLLPLVGRGADVDAYKLPKKLGHWHANHSAKVRAACPELEGTVRAIEALIAQRSPAAVLAKYGPQKVGGWRKKRPSLNNQQEYELVGEWPPRHY
jgi:hypothetical protein